MNIRRVLFVFVAATGLAGFTPIAGSRAHRGSSVSPFLKVGAKAMPSSAIGPSYGLFTCQVGLTPGVACYDPFQIRHAYHIDTLINAGLTGKGKTIVIIDAFQSPNMQLELNTYDAFYGLPGLNGLGGAADPALGTFTQIAPDGLTPFDPTNGDMIGWAQEISLDVTWAHAIAPGANIVLVLAKSDQDADILSATKYAVDHRLGDVVSQSFGENESCMDPALLSKQHLLFSEATLKGMTLLASSGDFGSAQPSCDGTSLVQAVSSPASDPLVTAVGGTELHAADYCLIALGCDPTANPAPGTYQGEIAWNEGDPIDGATGGAFSVLFDQPFYQRGTVPGKRLGVPDVSYSAAVNHGLLTFLDIPGIPVGFYLFGGTSAGSPQWAALVAIADQKTVFDLGFINAALYRVGQKHYSASFFDVTSGNNALFVPGFAAGPGWDATTGLGSPVTDQLISNVIRYESPADGLIEIAESLLHSLNLPQGRGHMGPH
ncbi:MAG: S53 family peptidase [Acidobacteriia bacterium]|nr:S53 family peptidase [Terriglobia bacterium]